MGGAVKALVTGCAGFIGSHLTERLLEAGWAVVGYDNFSTGQERFLARAARHPAFSLVRADVLDVAALRSAMAGTECVFHLAANADVRHGAEHPGKDLEQNTLATWNVLECMRTERVGRLVFASSAAVYGEPRTFPTPEDAPFPVQTSMYGASKLACEGLISAYCEAFGLQAWILRFVSILGERYSHGHVFDFCRQLRSHPGSLRVLGDGHQRKSYLYVEDCVAAMLMALGRARERVNILNLGTDGFCEVRESIGWITAALGLSPQVSYERADRGWIGDSPCIYLDTTRIRDLGWRPRLNIEQSVRRTVAFLVANPWLLDESRAS